MSATKVMVTLQFQSRKSNVEIESVIMKTDLYKMAEEQLCFKEDSIILKQYVFDEKAKKWELVTGEEESGKLKLEEGMKLKLKRPDIQEGVKPVDSVGKDDKTEDIQEDVKPVDSIEKDDKTELMCLPFFTTSLNKSRQPDTECYAAYLPEDTLWKGEGETLKKKLTVYFFEDENDNVLQDIYYKYEPLTPDVIMEIVHKYWKIEGEDEKYIPKFERVMNHRKADIRVRFTSKGMNRSRLGSDAQTVEQDKPTLFLNFRKLDNYAIRATVVHEFGHVLGLGHEHQHPSYWHAIKKFLSLDKMKKDLNVKDEEFLYQWTCRDRDQTKSAIISDYDEESVMHYHTKLSWLKDPKYRDKDELEHLKQNKDITEEEYKALKGFHRHVEFIWDSPSKKDKENLAKAYRYLSENQKRNQN